MTVKEAVRDAMNHYEWNVGIYEPTSVDIYFETNDGIEDETQLDLYGGTDEEKIAELESLWISLCGEFNAEPNSITGVSAYGYIRD